MAVYIPEQLKKNGFRFIKLNGKIPFEKDWQNTNNYEHDNQKLLNHNGNVGVLCGKENLVVIDIDGNSKETLALINEKLPQTYTVQTGKQGHHLYYTTDEIVKTTALEFNKSHIDIKAEGGQVVMEGSIHPETKVEYSFYHNDNIQNITKKQLLDFFDLSQSNGVTVTKKPQGTDESRSATEYQAVCSFITKGNTKDQVYKKMEAFEKWKNAPDAYREKTYNKALNFIEQSKSQPVTNENIRYRVLEYLADNNSNTKHESRLEAEEILVSYLIEKYKFKTIQQDEHTEVWAYSKGIYKPIGKSLAREEIRNILGRGYSENLCKKVLDKLTADTYINPKDFFQNEYPYLLPVENGLLNIKTLELNEFNDEYIFFTKVPIEYDIHKKCPNIIKHLKLVLKNKDDIKLFKEALGNCLLKKYTFQKAVMLVGSGRNGKGVTLDLITRLLGIENCSAVTLEQLENDNFTLSELHGKLANIGGDLNRTSLENTGNFKSATGGDLLTAPRKFMTPLYFINYAKFFFACNELPHVYDNSRGFWDRWLYFEFPYTFCTKEEYETKSDTEKKNFKIGDPQIKDKLFLKEELQGFLNFALEGLSSLLKHNQFTESQSFEEIKNKWARQSDSFKAFCMDMIEESWDEYISKTDLKRVYNDYCKTNKIRPVSDKHIHHVLTTEYGIVSKQLAIGRVWEGAKFK